MKVQWLEDSDKENIEKETLEEQYKIVKKETNTSMVEITLPIIQYKI